MQNCADITILNSHFGLFVFLSWHLFEGSQVSKVTLCVQIVKEPTPHPANLSHMVLAFLPLQLSLRYSSPHLVDRPTQLICISDIYLFICQQTNTKDIALLLAGQSATPHHGFPLISLARYPPPTGWFVEAAKRGDLWFLSGMPNSWQKIDARWLHIWTLWFITCVFLGNISIFLNSCISNKWENWKIVKC